MTAWFREVLPVIVPSGWRIIERREDGSKYHHGVRRLLVILSAEEHGGRRWLHLSCSHVDRLPKWSELVDVKETFLGLERHAYQVVPARSMHVNIHPNVLHLYAAVGGPEPLPDFTRGSGSL